MKIIDSIAILTVFIMFLGIMLLASEAQSAELYYLCKNPVNNMQGWYQGHCPSGWIFIKQEYK